MILGPRQRASYHADLHLPVSAKVRLPPGTAEAVLGVPVTEVAQRSVPLSALWGTDAGLPARLAAAGEHEAVRRELEARLRAAPVAVMQRARLTRTAAAALLRPGPNGLRPTVAEVARRLSISERQLRSVFTSVVGLAPKRFASIERVRAVTEADLHRDLAEVAVASGYYDQAHLTADFRAAMGVTPGEFRAGRFPPPTACRG